MSLLAHLKKLACRFMLVYEFCRDCGRSVDQVWTSSDSLWARLARSKNAPPLCLGCFDSRAREAGLLLRWVPFDANRALSEVIQ